MFFILFVSVLCMQVVHMCAVTQPMVAGLKLKRVLQTLEERRAGLLAAATQCAQDQATFNVSYVHIHILEILFRPNFETLQLIKAQIKSRPTSKFYLIGRVSVASLFKTLLQI